MNYRLVLKTYTALRQLTGEESALLNTLRGMSDAERELAVEALNPTKGTGKGLKRTTKKRGKSQRAAALSDQMKGNLQRREPTTGGFADDTDMINTSICAKCDYGRDHNIHHLANMTGYHEFTPAQPAAAGGED